MAELVSFLPLVAIALLFWLMVVRPASRRQKELRRVQSELRPGQRVMLSSGIYGTVTTIGDDRVHVELAPGVVVEVVRAAIGAVDEAAGDAVPPTAESGD
ncbi:preprotein translocase subunit YajC [Nocardioides gansuensis]|uniref:Preprotein translocase subunit YajC n=1 Tax=Nocardioides gansuensis TaxID=2138300 RepID=A0A2T8FB08_9ACTN|nr:preprotein translocase subunit YajC [Nocardioides gansuensis]PVG82865.1 preprotein translocase subunit YajC [Nocardioides gansuensis]